MLHESIIMGLNGVGFPDVYTSFIHTYWPLSELPLHLRMPYPLHPSNKSTTHAKNESDLLSKLCYWFESKIAG